MATSLFATIYNSLSLGNVLLLLVILFLLHYMMVLYEFRDMPPGPRLTCLPVLGNIFSLDPKEEKLSDAFKRSVITLFLTLERYGFPFKETHMCILSSLMRSWLRRLRLHILRVLKCGGVPPADLLKVYFALIRSVLEYCCPMWPVKLSDSIERVQKRALRIIYPALHYQEALVTTGCVSLQTRRKELCSKLFTKITEPESRLRHLVPPTRSQAHGRSLRNKDRPSLISCKTERFKKSFFPAMCLHAHGM